MCPSGEQEAKGNSQEGRDGHYEHRVRHHLDARLRRCEQACVVATVVLAQVDALQLLHQAIVELFGSSDLGLELPVFQLVVGQLSRFCLFGLQLPPDRLLGRREVLQFLLQGLHVVVDRTGQSQVMRLFRRG